MNHLIYLSFTAAACTAALHAQELPADMAAEATSVPSQSAPPVPEVVHTPQPQQQTEPDSQLPPGEQRIRAGIVMLSMLNETMSGINDQSSADAAVATVMRLAAELNTWAQGFTSLPPMSEDEQVKCEDYYLPIIRRLNTSIKHQGERLAAAEYYGSQQLPAALVRLALLNQ